MRKLISIKNKFANINSYGSIGCEYFDIALGNRDFALLSRLYPWDHIPGVFIVRQSGGHDCHFDKKEYKFLNDINETMKNTVRAEEEEEDQIDRVGVLPEDESTTVVSGKINEDNVTVYEW